MGCTEYKQDKPIVHTFTTSFQDAASRAASSSRCTSTVKASKAQIPRQYLTAALLENQGSRDVSQLHSMLDTPLYT
jgi:hypothetical protein